ncbi:centrosomal protein kizuna isoform X3 [Heliangelus exortis]|uniref:centrosomal protein kizuna isoform X3 n=1 Tax=Heliangelus exortis TaxID=472823 RepID=UPI003A8F51C1
MSGTDPVGPGHPQPGHPRPGCQGLGSLLRCLRDSEARRLELERKLIEYRKSDAYLTKVKHMKLKKYLKEIDERHKGALLRNQRLLREFDRFEAHVKTSGSEMIQKMEAWYGREMKSTLPLQEGDLSAEGNKEEDQEEQMLGMGMQAGISTREAMPRGLFHPATVSMGHHTSSISAAGGLDMGQNPPQAAESSLVPDLPLCPLSLGGLGQKSRSTDLEGDASVEEAGRRGDLASSEEGSKQLISSSCAPEEEQLQGNIPGPDSVLNNWGACQEVSQECSPELPVSTEEEMLSTPGEGQGRVSPAASWGPQAAEGPPLQPPPPPTVQEEPSISSVPDRASGMLSGLSCALQLIEEVVVRMSPQHRVLYQQLGTMGTAELLSFCNRAGSLKEDDLEACEAVVLHQLQALLQSTLNSCHLPEETLDAGGRVVDEKQTRTEQQWDLDVLRAQLGDHGIFLRKHQVQLTEEVAEMFERLLVSGKEAEDGQALPVLREALPEECGDRSSIQSNESSCSLPLIPDTSREIKQAKHLPQLTSTGEQGEDIGNNSSKTKESLEMHLESSSSSNERSLPLSRTETRKGIVPVIKSKAFWGESDDSSSEIEAALRPQTHSTGADEFDDFYD